MNIIFSGTYNAVEMNCIVGDILQADTMAIGTICDQRFALNGGLARVIKEAAGNGFMASLRAAESEQISAAKAVHITSAQNIRAQYVLLMPIGRHITLDVAYAGIFQKAQTLNITSLTIPLFGTGQLGMQLDLCTAYLKTALMQMHNFGSLQKINFIDKHERTMRSLGDFLAAEIHVSPQHIIIQPPPTGPMPSNNSAAGNQADQPSTSSSSAQQNNHNQPPPQQDDHSILLWPNTNMAYAGPTRRRTTARMSTGGMSTTGRMRTSAVNSSFRAIGSGTRDSPIQLMTPARVATTNTGGGGDGPQSQQQEEQPTSAVLSSSSDDEAMEQEDHSNNSTLSSDSNSTELEDSDEEDSSDDSSPVDIANANFVDDSDDDGDEEMDVWTKKGDKLLTKEEKSLWSPISMEKLRHKSQKENNRLSDKPTCSKNVAPPGPRLDDTSEPCSICLTDMREEQENDDGGIVQLSLCSHQFHLECIRSAFKVKKQCPLCMCWYGSPIGCQPKDATMKVRLVPGKIPGCRGVNGFHEITYHIPAGIQTSDHIRPGKPYGASTRVAFLPNNKEGTEVLKLLQLAFKRRLTFTIGDSVTSGKQNVVIWNGIHHKTSMTGGPYGYPDAGYLRRVKEELASLGVRVEQL